MEVRAEAEAVAVVPEPTGASSALKQHKLPEPALPNPTRSTETCLAWHILIRQLASPRTPTATANGSVISSRIPKLDTSAPGNHGRAARVAKAKRSRKPLERTWMRMMLRRMPKKVPQKNPGIHGPKRPSEHTILS